MITADTLQAIPLFSALPYSERETIAGRAADIRLRADDWLLHEGEMPAFHAVLEGRLALFKHVATHEQQIGTLGPGEFIGEVSLLLGSGVLASIRATEPARIMRLNAEDFRELLGRCHVLNTAVLRTMATRVSALQQLSTDAPTSSVTLTGPRFDPACYELRDFLVRNHVPFQWVEPDGSSRDDAAQPVRDRNEVGGRAWPVLQVADTEPLIAPSLKSAAERIGLATRPMRDNYDVVIIGGGPAGLAAAVYGASEGLQTLLVERTAPGGQAGTSSRIENYLGFPTGVSGEELSLRARSQATRFGAELLVARSTTDLSLADDGCYDIALDADEHVRAASVVLATGVKWRTLKVPGIDTFLGRGIYYGAARTEARMVRGQSICLVGGGNSAGQAAMLFSDYANDVTLLVRGPALADSMSQYLIEQLASKANVHVETNCEVAQVEGPDRVESITVVSGLTGERTRQPCAALFVFIGAKPETHWLPSSIIRDRWNYVCTGRDVLDLLEQSAAHWPLERDPYLLETSAPGVFAAGDVRHGSIKRVASGVGEGSMAIAFVHQYLAERPVARQRAVAR